MSLGEEILIVAEIFGDHQTRLTSLPLSLSGLGITNASYLFSFALLSSRFDTLDLETC